LQKQIQNTSENESVTRPEAAQLLRARPRTVNCQMPIHLSKSTIAKRRCETQSGQGGGNRAGVLRKIVGRDLLKIYRGQLMLKLLQQLRYAARFVRSTPTREGGRTSADCGTQRRQHLRRRLL